MKARKHLCDDNLARKPRGEVAWEVKKRIGREKSALENGISWCNKKERAALRSMQAWHT